MALTARKPRTTKSGRGTKDGCIHGSICGVVTIIPYTRANSQSEDIATNSSSRTHVNEPSAPDCWNDPSGSCSIGASSSIGAPPGGGGCGGTYRLT